MFRKALIIVCDDKDMVYANYLIQLIGQVDDNITAAIYTAKTYKDNLPKIPSKQCVLFIGQNDVAKEQRKTIPDKFNQEGMHYGWLGKRAVLYVEDISNDWLKLKELKGDYASFLQFSKERGMAHPDALAEYVKKFGNWKTAAAVVAGGVVAGGVVAGKALVDLTKTVKEVKAQQYRTLIKVFYEDSLKLFVEG